MNNSKDDHTHDDIGCLQAIEAFYSYLDGELEDPKSIKEFEHHIGHCRSCYSRADVERLLTNRMSESAKSSAPEQLQDRLRKLMDEF